MAERGGFRQQLERHKQLQQAQEQAQDAPMAESSTGRTKRKRNTDIDKVDESKLAILLLEKWAWGDMSLPMLQSIAEAGVEDGLGQPLLRLIVFLGDFKGAKNFTTHCGTHFFLSRNSRHSHKIHGNCLVQFIAHRFFCR